MSTPTLAPTLPPPPVDDPPAGPDTGGNDDDREAVTLWISPTTQAARDRLLARGRLLDRPGGGVTLDDVVNAALQVYAASDELDRRGGRLYVVDAEDPTVAERLRFL